jgi:hypothetical protein
MKKEPKTRTHKNSFIKIDSLNLKNMMKRILLIVAMAMFLLKITQAQDFWEVLNAPPNIFVHSTNVNSNGIIFIGLNYTTGGGVLRSDDGGYNWMPTGLQNIGIYSIVITHNNIIYAGSDRVYRSPDNGNYWDIISPQIDPISLFVSSNNNIFAGIWGGIYKSDTIGSGWVQVLLLENFEVVNAIVEDTITGELYAGSINFINGGGVYRSVDDGDNWEHFGLTDHYVSSLAFNSSGDLFAGTRGHYSLGTGGVFKLPHGQTEWKNLNNEELVTSLVINSEDDIYIGCSTLDYFWGGVRRSLDDGQNWEDISLETMYDRDITAMILDPQEHLYACEHNSPTPMYKSVNPTITSIPGMQINRGIDAVNFPNPFSVTTNIWYKLENEAAIQLNIYNYTGQLIKVIDEGTQPKGSHSIEFNAKGLKDGVYLYSISLNGKATETRKMTIMN